MFLIARRATDQAPDPERATEPVGALPTSPEELAVDFVAEECPQDLAGLLCFAAEKPYVVRRARFSG